MSIRLRSRINRSDIVRCSPPESPAAGATAWRILSSPTCRRAGMKLAPIRSPLSVPSESRRVEISLMLEVENARAATDWYKQAFGAAELWSLGSVVGLEIDGAPFFLHEPTQRGFESPKV